MSIYSLSKTFQRLKILGKSTSVAKCSTSVYIGRSNVVPALLTTHVFQQPNTSNDTIITFSPRSIQLDINLPTNIGIIKNIIELPFSIKKEIENPLKNTYNKEDITPEIAVDLPTNGATIDKLAAIPGIRVIRRKKMKKHKRRKFRKRMKYVFLKVNLRRAIKRERLFQAELWAKVKEAQKFDAKAYVESRIDLLTRERLPPTYRGEVLPEHMIKKFLDEKKSRREAKRNRIRLTL